LQCGSPTHLIQRLCILYRTLRHYTNTVLLLYYYLINKQCIAALSCTCARCCWRNRTFTGCSVCWSQTSMERWMCRLASRFFSFHACRNLILSGVASTFVVVFIYRNLLIMVALCNRADHYIFMLWFVLLSFFFPRLISAVGDWMFTILWHLVWP